MILTPTIEEMRAVIASGGADSESPHLWKSVTEEERKRWSRYFWAMQEGKGLPPGGKR